MTPRRRLDADAWRVAVVLFVGGWLAVDPAPLSWPVGYWLIGAFIAFGIHEALAGRDRLR